MQASVSLTLKVSDNDFYVVDLSIPTTIPSFDEPFDFKVDHRGKDEAKGKPIFIVAVGMQEGESAYYVGVEPPSNLLEMAGVGDYIGDLKVLAEDGKYHYDPDSNKFTAQ
jgi:hypothetical protein